MLVVAPGDLEGGRGQYEQWRPLLNSRQKREREALHRLARDSVTGNVSFASVSPGRREGELPSGEAYSFQARGKGAPLDIGVVGGTPEAACRQLAWGRHQERWEWPEADWLEPVAREALLRELLAAYRAENPSDAAPRVPEPVVAAPVAAAKAKEGEFVILDRDLSWCAAMGRRRQRPNNAPPTRIRSIQAR